MYHNTEVINKHVVPPSHKKEVYNQHNVAKYNAQCRFGEIEIGGMFLFNNQPLIKDGEYSASTLEDTGKMNFQFQKKNLVHVKRYNNVVGYENALIDACQLCDGIETDEATFNHQY